MRWIIRSIRRCNPVLGLGIIGRSACGRGLKVAGGRALLDQEVIGPEEIGERAAHSEQRQEEYTSKEAAGAHWPGALFSQPSTGKFPANVHNVHSDEHVVSAILFVQRGLARGSTRAAL